MVICHTHILELYLRRLGKYNTFTLNKEERERSFYIDIYVIVKWDINVQFLFINNVIVKSTFKCITNAIS